MDTYEQAYEYDTTMECRDNGGMFMRNGGRGL